MKKLPATVVTVLNELLASQVHIAKQIELHGKPGTASFINEKPVEYFHGLLAGKQAAMETILHRYKAYAGYSIDGLVQCYIYNGMTP